MTFISRHFSSERLVLYATLFLAVILRALNLEHGQSFHPDERHIVMTTAGMSWDNLNPKTFAYGSLPFYLMFLIGQALWYVWENAPSYDGQFIVGRALSVAFGVAAVWLTYRLGKSLTGNPVVGLIAAALLAVNPFHIQLSRYATVDVILTTFNLAALLGCVKIVSTAGRRGKLFTTIMVGFSLSTKISSLSLGLPVALSLLWGFGPRTFWRQRTFWFSAVCMLLGIALVSFITQPYAVFDSATFFAHTTEQVNMVRGIWRPPYVIQYAHTTPYLYHLNEMFHYMVGAPVFLAFAIGLLLVLKACGARFDARWFVVLAWTAAVFLIVGRYQVKFPRYFLPLYPIVMILAAYALAHAIAWGKKWGGEVWGYAPTVLVLLIATFSGVAFVQIYREAHTYEQASYWIYSNIPNNSRLLGVHWDDKLPLILPGLNAHERGYRYESSEDELPLYEGDSPQKLTQMSERLAGADYLIFPTARTYGSLLRVPEEYPETTKLIQLLFAQRLGYDLIASFKVRPSLFGRSLNDDLADESYSVYDHPKALIFMNRARLSADEIRQRVMDSSISREELPTRQEIMLAEAGTKVESAALGSATALEQFWSVLKWYLLFQVLSLLIAPLLSRIFSNAPDLGYSLSKVVAIPIFAFLVWVLGIFVGYPLIPATLWILLVASALLVAQWLWFEWSSIRILLAAYRKEIIWVESLCAIGFLLHLTLRAFNPEIFWGEKPMDFTFLNYFARLEAVPPDDPWFYRPGDEKGMSYYYLGFFAFGLLLKLTGIPAGVAYTLGLATVGTMALLAAYGTLLWILRTRIAALLGALLLMLMSNLEVLRLWLWEGEKPNFDLYWASSRVLTSPAITEYPFWTQLFADFHPHLMALPITVSLIGLALSPILKVVGPRAAPVAAGLTALIWGSLVGFNSWDAIVYGLLIAGAAFAWLVQIVADPYARKEQLNLWFGALIAFSIVGLATVSAFSSTSHSGVAVQWGYVYGNEFNTLGQLFRHLGIWLIPLFVASLVLLLRERGLRRARAIIIAFGSAVLLCAVPVTMSVVQGVEAQPWGVLSIACVLILLGVLWLQARHGRIVLNAAGLLLIFSGLIVLNAELFFLMDRMNTIFKFYLPLWSFLGIATSGVLYEVWKGVTITSSMRHLRITAVGISAVIFLIGLSGTLLNAWIMTSFQRVEGPRPSLDGTAYLEQLDGDEARMIRWLNRSIKGVEPIAEAWGNSYAEYTRISMHTGLPTILGWDHHVYQRGATHAEIDQRKREVREIYTTRDPQRLRELLTKFGVSLVVVGNVERRAYPGERGLVFRPEEVPGISIVKQFGPVSLLKVE